MRFDQRIAVDPVHRLLIPSGMTRHEWRLRSDNLRALAVIFGMLGLSTWAVAAAGLRIQHTASLPIGLYRTVRIDELPPRLVRGTIGLWCLPEPTGQWALARGYLHAGVCASGVEPLAKVALAIEGDTVDFDARGVTFAGRLVPHTVPPILDVSGRPLRPTRYGRYVIAHDAVWVWSPYTGRSFDSRYLGPLSRSTLIAVVRPVWVH